MEAAHLPDELFDLLAEKSYSELSSEEQSLVDPYLTAKEYDEMHSLIGEVKLADQQMLTISKKPQPLPQKSWIHRVLHYPIPMYQAAAVIALLMGGYWLWAPALPGSGNDATLPYVRTGTSIEWDSYPDSLVFQL
ncbi:MAG: hypothetical protein AAFY48_12100 [Bacteroidota bacterium]